MNKIFTIKWKYNRGEIWNYKEINRRDKQKGFSQKPFCQCCS